MTMVVRNDDCPKFSSNQQLQVTDRSGFPGLLLHFETAGSRQFSSTAKVKFMKHVLVTAALILLPSIGLAQSQLDRFEAVSDDLNLAMIEAMAKEIDSLGGDGDIMRNADIKQIDWTSEIRDAAQCILDSYNDEVGSDAVDVMLDNMEKLAPMIATVTMTEATEDDMMESMSPEGISEDRIIEISNDCDMIRLQSEQMGKTGFMEAMMAAGATVPDND